MQYAITPSSLLRHPIEEVFSHFSGKLQYPRNLSRVAVILALCSGYASVAPVAHNVPDIANTLDISLEALRTHRLPGASTVGLSRGAVSKNAIRQQSRVARRMDVRLGDDAADDRAAQAFPFTQQYGAAEKSVNTLPRLPAYLANGLLQGGIAESTIFPAVRYPRSCLVHVRLHAVQYLGMTVQPFPPFYAAIALSRITPYPLARQGY